MKKINSLILIIIITFIFSIAISCDSSDIGDNPQPTENIYKNLEGRQIRILSGGNTGPVVDNYKDLDDPTIRLEMEKVRKIQADYNCLFEYVFADKKIYNSLLKGDPIADIIDISNINLFYIKLISLDRYSDILDIDNPSLWNVNRQRYLSENNEIKILSPNKAYLDITFNSVLYFNKKMLIDEGLWSSTYGFDDNLNKTYNLYDMQRNGTWNWDAFTELCNRVAKDTNNDGVVDRFGFIYNDYIVDGLAFSNGNGNSSLLSYTTNENKFLVNIDQKPQRAALDLISSLIKSESILFPDSVFGRLDYFDRFKKGKALFLSEYFYNLESFKDMGEKLGIIAYPVGPNNTDKSYNIQNSYYEMYGILNTAENPRDLSYILRLFAAAPLPLDEMIEKYSEYLKTKYPYYDPEIFETYKLLSKSETAGNCILTNNYPTIRILSDDLYKYFDSESEYDIFSEIPDMQTEFDQLFSNRLIY